MNWFNARALASQLRGLATLPVAALMVSLCSACATAPTINNDVAIHFPSSEMVTTTQQADVVLDDVALARAQIDWRFRQKEQICYSRFFVNSCLLEAKNQRHQDLARVKTSEVEANFFKRKTNVDEMDRNLAEKNLEHPLPNPNEVKASAENGK